MFSKSKGKLGEKCEQLETSQTNNLSTYNLVYASNEILHPLKYYLNLVPRGGTKESRWMTEWKSGVYFTIRIE